MDFLQMEGRVWNRTPLLDFLFQVTTTTPCGSIYVKVSCLSHSSQRVVVVSLDLHNTASPLCKCIWRYTVSTTQFSCGARWEPFRDPEVSFPTFLRRRLRWIQLPPCFSYPHMKHCCVPEVLLQAVLCASTLCSSAVHTFLVVPDYSGTGNLRISSLEC